MPEFWAGAASALLGAVVGGLFSAFAARMQVKNAFKVAGLQIEAANEQVMRATQYQLRQRALIEISLVIEKILAAALDLSSLHNHPTKVLGDPACKPIPDNYKRIRDLSPEMERARTLYLGFLPPGSTEILDRVEDCFAVNLDRVLAYQRVKNSPCVLEGWAEELCQVTDMAIRDLRVLSGFAGQGQEG